MSKLSSEWNEFFLGDVFKVSSGDMTMTKSSFKAFGFTAFSASGPDGLVEKYQHEGEGVVVSSVGAKAGKVFKASGKWTAIKNTIVIEIADENFDIDYLFHLLSIEGAFTQEGGAQPFISQKQILKTAFKFPPYFEQKKIADILSRVDLNLQLLKIKIQKIFNLKQSLINNFIYQNCIGEKIVDSKIFKLNDICIKIQDGTHFSPKSSSGSFLYLTSKNIRNGFMNLSDVQFISEKDHSEIYRRCDVKYGDILLTKDGASTGNACINTLNYPFSLLSSVAFLRVDKSKCSPDFLLQSILSHEFQTKIKGEMTGNAITRLTLTKIKNLKIKLPSLENQKKFGESLNALDKQINLINQKINQTYSLKNGLSNALLSGQKRVKV